MEKIITFLCDFCGKEKTKPKRNYNKTKTGKHFCSLSCGKRWLDKNLFDCKGEKNPNFKNWISKNKVHYKKIQEERYPEKAFARKQVAKALRNKSLIKKPCEKCGDEKSFAHHEDYSNALDIIWLCRKHHREVHGNLH